MSPVTSFFAGFKKFLLQGNLLTVAVAFVMATAFGAVVKALITDIITPIIAAIVGGRQPDFQTFSFTINGSHFHYGDLINVVLAFVVTALAVYLFIVKPYEMYQSSKDATVKDCPECTSEIPIEARRCPLCTAAIG